MAFTNFETKKERKDTEQVIIAIFFPDEIFSLNDTNLRVM